MKEKYSIYAHENRFDTNEKCLDFLMNIRWDGGIPTCPQCGNRHMNYYLKTRKVYKCSECYKQFSVVKGTLFEKSKIPLKIWFTAIYIFTTYKRGVSSCQLSKILGIKQHTAWYMQHRLREALINEGEIILSGIVQVDEAFIGPKIKLDKRLQKLKKIHDDEQEQIHGMSESKARRVRGYAAKTGRKPGSTKEVLAQKKIENEAKGERRGFERNTIVLGLMEKGGKVILKKIAKHSSDMTREVVHPILKKYIAPGSSLHTDQSSLYRRIKFLNHKSVNHKKWYVGKGGVHTNGIEGVWKHYRKIFQGTYFHMSYHHFDRYLNEFTYRWNRRDTEVKFLFDDFIPLLVGKRVCYKELIERNKRKLAA